MGKYNVFVNTDADGGMSLRVMREGLYISERELRMVAEHLGEYIENMLDSVELTWRLAGIRIEVYGSYVRRCRLTDGSEEDRYPLPIQSEEDWDRLLEGLSRAQASVVRQLLISRGALALGQGREAGKE